MRPFSFRTVFLAAVAAILLAFAGGYLTTASALGDNCGDDDECNGGHTCGEDVDCVKVWCSFAECPTGGGGDPEEACHYCDEIPPI